MHFFDPITDFIFIENEPEPADVIFIPGGPCGEIALHAAELFHQGYAPLLLPSGCHSILAPVTYENAIYTRNLTDALGLTVRTALLSCQAYHARRALLYYQALFPETRILGTPTVTQGIRREDWFERSKTIDLVLQEVEHCGSQFHEILKKYPEPAIPVR